jgi:hypothetical protein
VHPAIESISCMPFGRNPARMVARLERGLCHTAYAD